MANIKRIAKMIRDYGYFAVEASNAPAEYALFIALSIGECHCLLKGDNTINIFITDIENDFILPPNTAWHYETSMDGSYALVFEQEYKKEDAELIAMCICEALAQLIKEY